MAEKRLKAVQNPSAELSRVPPQSLEAEAAILSAIFTDNDCLTDVMEILTAADFYSVAHQKIFAAIETLFSRNEPADLVTLGNQLKEKGQLEEVGGPAYLARIADSAPFAYNARHYARIVRDKGALRRLISKANEITRRCFDDQGDVDGVIDFAETAIFEVSEDKIKPSFFPLSHIIESNIDALEERQGNRTLITGVPTGFTRLDEMTSGLQASDLIILAARPSMGKCCEASTEILLSDGSVTPIEAIYQRKQAKLLTLTEDWKFDSAHPSHFIDDHKKPVFRVTTRLGRFVETTLTHPFLTIQGWKPLSRLNVKDKIAVPRKLAVFGTETMRKCEIKLLAYLIGDGNLTNLSPRFFNRNPRILDDYINASRDFGGLRTSIGGSTASVCNWGNAKHVPSLWVIECISDFLQINPMELIPRRADAISGNSKSTLVRWLEELGIQGKNSHGRFIPSPVFKLPRHLLALFLNRLFATDGWASILKTGQVQLGYSSVSERLIRQVQHLLLRFGIIAKIRNRRVIYKTGRRATWQLDIIHGDSIRVFCEEIGIFGKETAIESIKNALASKPYKTNTDENLLAMAESDVYWDEIVSIEPMGEKQVYDLTVPDTHNFVANDICVHNTAFALNLARNSAIEGETPVAVFSLEMSKEQLSLRMLCAEAGVDSSRLRSGFFSQEDWERLTDAAGNLSEAPIFIDDSPGLTVMEIRAKSRRLKMEQGLGLVIIDYLQLMRGRAGVERRELEISEISRSLKGLAKELNIPVVALSQLNRKLEERSDKRPQLSDLRESGSLEQDADVVAFIYRDEVYNKDENNPKRGTAEIILGKQRNGPVGTVNLTFINTFTRFENPAPEYDMGGEAEY